MDQPPIVARDLLVAPEGDAGLRATVHAAVESYGCTQHVPPLPLSDCGERFYRHDGRSDAVDEPAAVARRGSSLRAVLTEGAILVPEQVDGGGVSLRTLAGDELTDGDARRSLPLRVDEPTLRGLRVNDRIVWVSTFGDTLQRIETDLTGAPTAVHPPHALNAGGASLTALERVQDTLWAALATRDGMKICRWPLANPAQVSVIDVGIGSDADLAYDADADQVYFCSVAFGTAAVQRLTTDGRLLPHPRPATFHVDTNARCSVAATARGAVVFTRQHHDGVVSWARYGCPSVRAPQ